MKLRDVMDRCRSDDRLFVRYPGGLAALDGASREDVASYEFDEPSRAGGENDCIAAPRFVDAVRAKSKIALDAAPSLQPRSPSRLASASAWDHFQDKVAFRTMVRVCEQRGARVIVGFEGGRSELRRSSLAYLYQREYKIDDPANPTGIKYAPNWIPGDEFLEILRELRAI